MDLSADRNGVAMVLAPGSVTLNELRRLRSERVQLQMHESALRAVKAAHQAVTRTLQRGTIAYGINTGFGKFAQEIIPPDRLAELQTNLVLSHSTGTGALLPDEVVRMVMALKAVSLARGHSGVRPDVIDALLRLLNAGVYPCIPSKGSVGASGDLAPLAHLAAALIGVGEVRVGGRTMPAPEGLRCAGVEPLALAPKEGLALLNGTQVSTALGLVALFGAEDVLATALVTGALSLEAIKGSLKPFDARIHAARGHAGQIEVARVIRALVEGSAILASHADCPRVQDPYSIRCQPQVMGACLDNLRHAARVLEIESNAASDNPLIFAQDDTILSGGNFHAEPVAFVCDLLALVLAEIGALSERRIALLVDASLSGLPAFLVRDGGINSGFMVAHVTAAALASDNKALSFPSTVDSLPTSANQEDHVSMATNAARRLREMVENSATIVGIEAMAAAQGIEFHRPLTSSTALEQTFQDIRRRVAFYERDRFLAPDIEAMKQWVLSAPAHASVKQILPSEAA
ncbi:MAG TPA: histidine ammonia-lyase [Burkholderiales bacterium]|nr:histidine ammonia-lyase [Burkholderiales bacterium]